jgi:RNA polymerase sigma-70 factor, ECF subfamily
MGWQAMNRESDGDLVRRAVDGEASARHALVLYLGPVVQRRVCRPLARSQAARGRGVERSEVLDLTQQILLLLFDRDSRVLRSWDPGRGLSLASFVGLVAEREARAILRSGRRSAWAETPGVEDDISELVVEDRAVEDHVVSRDELARIWHQLEEELSPRGLELFRALLIEQLSIEETSAKFDMSSNALYTFRSRLRQRVHAIRGELASVPAPGTQPAVLRLPRKQPRPAASRGFQGSTRGER